MLFLDRLGRAATPPVHLGWPKITLCVQSISSRSIDLYYIIYYIIHTNALPPSCVMLSARILHKSTVCLHDLYTVFYRTFIIIIL